MKSYSSLEKILHRQFLGDTAVSNQLFERLLSKSRLENSNDFNKHIFISGLARAGTTALLNKIYSSGEISSFTYKYMPFILSPSLAKIYSNFIKDNNIISSSRYHNDGIEIDINSPECLDEIFWIKSNKCNDKNRDVKDIDNHILKSYSYLINQFANIGGKDRMLIKNNNNHIRIESLSDYFKDSYFLVVLRDPIAHSMSLLSQHLNFLKLQKLDPFILEYMNLIGHCEFGSNTIPFIYPTDEGNPFGNYCKKNIEYWLIQWINTYNWILKSDVLKRKNVYLIPYEDLCNDSSVYLKICQIIGISNTHSGIPFKSANKVDHSQLNLTDTSLIEKAMNIYNDLHNLFLNQF
tara:strand:- start:26 stop:1075 length:1050 start_codon:yes stop_codon:yes gene_type:complete